MLRKGRKRETVREEVTYDQKDNDFYDKQRHKEIELLI